MNKNERNVESTTSVEGSEMGTWQAAMQDAPVFRSAGGQRERAVVTPLYPSHKQESHKTVANLKNPDFPGKLVVRVAKDEATGKYDTVEDYDNRPSRKLNVSENSKATSEIGTSIAEAQAAAQAPEADAEGAAGAAEMNATEKELMQAKLDAMYKEMSAIEKALGDEGKTPEQIREQKMKKVGRGLLKFGLKTVEILGGAAAGAAFPALFTLLSNII